MIWCYLHGCTHGNSLQPLLEVCCLYAEPHGIVYNTTKTDCMLVRLKQSQGRCSTRVRLGDKELSIFEEFSYLGHVMTAGCRDYKDVVKQSWGKIQLSICCGQEVLLDRKFLLQEVRNFTSYC